MKNQEPGKEDDEEVKLVRFKFLLLLLVELLMQLLAIYTLTQR